MLDKLLRSLEAGQHYEAQQMLQTVYYRYRARKQLEEAYQLLQVLSRPLIGHSKAPCCRRPRLAVISSSSAPDATHARRSPRQVRGACACRSYGQLGNPSALVAPPFTLAEPALWSPSAGGRADAAAEGPAERRLGAGIAPGRSEEASLLKHLFVTSHVLFDAQHRPHCLLSPAFITSAPVLTSQAYATDKVAVSEASLSRVYAILASLPTPDSDDTVAVSAAADGAMRLVGATMRWCRQCVATSVP